MDVCFSRLNSFTFDIFRPSITDYAVLDLFVVKVLTGSWNYNFFSIYQQKWYSTNMNEFTVSTKKLIRYLSSENTGVSRCIEDPSAVVWSLVGLLSLWHIPHFHSQFYVINVSSLIKTGALQYANDFSLINVH